MQVAEQLERLPKANEVGLMGRDPVSELWQQGYWNM